MRIRWTLSAIRAAAFLDLQLLSTPARLRSSHSRAWTRTWGTEFPVNLHAPGFLVDGFLQIE